MIKISKSYKKLKEFEAYMTGEKKNCKNKCIFCFIDQLPKDCLRETLYFKDDDERLSFLHGNYITLTNLEDSHIDRIVKMRISPINISVHTTNPGLRVKMMNNKRAGEVLPYIKRLSDANISINAQIVLCKNINDGEELEKTLTDLCALPSIQSIAVVPSGLTKYRDENGLFRLEPLDKSDCENIINQVNKFKPKPVYCADEFFLKAGVEIPDADYYDDYPQYENGVGMIRSFCDDFYGDFDEIVGRAAPGAPEIITNIKSNLRRAEGVTPYVPQNPRKISLITGEAAYCLIKTLADDLINMCGNLNCTVYKIKNNFFGEDVTVAGLVTGRDIIEQLLPYKNNLGDELLIPAVMLRYERDLFLDNTGVEDIETALGVRVKIVENNAEDFIKKVMNI
jgi:NifB/MoaA-like Fe-S oxidoreductase